VLYLVHNMHDAATSSGALWAGTYCSSRVDSYGFRSDTLDEWWVGNQGRQIAVCVQVDYVFSKQTQPIQAVITKVDE